MKVSVTVTFAFIIVAGVLALYEQPSDDVSGDYLIFTEMPAVSASIAMPGDCNQVSMDIAIELDGEKCDIDYDPNTHTLSSTRTAEDTLIMLHRCLGTIYPYYNVPDVNDNVKVEFAEPNTDVNTDSWITPEPNDTDIENARKLGNILINYADFAQGLISEEEYVRRGSNELGRWEWTEPNEVK